MKKINILFLLIIALFAGINASAASWMFVWEEGTTQVEVPLGANIQNYLSKPTAKLYKDNVLLNDANISYITTGDWLYLLSDVDTNKVGSYNVWYKAYESKYMPGQCPGYKALITFNVVDKEKPVFKEYPKSIEYIIGNEKPDYKSQIIALDNSGACDIMVDDSNVNYEIPGEYLTLVTASDKYNRESIEIKVLVSDSVGPVVRFLGENNTIVIVKGEEASIVKYFNAVDKIDGDVTNSISYQAFSTNTALKFPLEVKFSDLNGNDTIVNVFIEIVDKDEAVIELYSNSLVIDYKDEFIPYIENNIKKATLGKQNILAEIKIDYSNIKNEVGTYKVIYSYDANGKSAYCECSVAILSSSSPIILVTNGSTSINKKLNIKELISVIDDSDKEIASKIEFDDSLVDYTKEGVYPVTVSVTNSSNLCSTETLYITVISEKTSMIDSSIEGDNKYILVMGAVIVVVITIGGFIFYKQKKNKKLQ